MRLFEVAEVDSVTLSQEMQSKNGRPRLLIVLCFRDEVLGHIRVDWGASHDHIERNNLGRHPMHNVLSHGRRDESTASRAFDNSRVHFIGEFQSTSGT